MERYLIGWIKLAEAIIEYARRDLSEGGLWAIRAQAFFNSEWYEELQGTVDLYRNRNNDISMLKEVKTLL